MGYCPVQEGQCPLYHVMTADIRWFRERLGSASLPWPVIVVAAAATAVILLASRATTAQAAELSPSPAPHAELASGTAGLLPTVNGLTTELPLRHDLHAARDTTRAFVRAVVQRTVDPVQQVAATAAQVVADLTAAAPPPPHGTAPGAPLPGFQRRVRTTAGLGLSGAFTPLSFPRAAGFSLAAGQLPSAPGPLGPDPLGPSPAAVSAVPGLTALGSALGIAGGLSVLLLTARGHPGPPVRMEPADLRLLVERPG